MLGKLLKYEFKATGRVMLPFLGGLLVLAVVARLASSVIGNNRVFDLLSTLILMAYFLSLVAMGTVTVVLLVYRFYRSMLSDEAYLTFMLPAGINAQLCSKLITAAVWLIVAFAALVLSLIIVTSPFELMRVVFSDLGAIFERFYAATGVSMWEVIACIFEVLLVILLMSVAGCLMFYASMSLGFGFAEHKVLYSILIFIGFGIVTQILFVLLMVALGMGLNSMSLHAITSMSALDIGHAVTLSICAAELVYCGALYAVTALALKRRLNLP